MKRLVSGRQRPIDRSTRDAKTFANLSGRQSALGSQRLYPCLEFFGHHCGSASTFENERDVNLDAGFMPAHQQPA